MVGTRGEGRKGATDSLSYRQAPLRFRPKTDNNRDTHTQQQLRCHSLPNVLYEVLYEVLSETIGGRGTFRNNRRTHLSSWCLVPSTALLPRVTAERDCNSRFFLVCSAIDSYGIEGPGIICKLAVRRPATGPSPAALSTRHHLVMITDLITL
jgi:hypothetical protein